MGDLPPLTALRAFEAVARHLSFTKAAKELGMTQAAVSYQIKILEERIGATLFHRLPRRIELTATAEVMAPEVSVAFERLKAAVAAARGQVDGTLSISSVPTFACQWLAANLGHFQIEQPQLAVRLDTSPKPIDFAVEDYDVAVKGLKGETPGLVQHLLLSADFTPMLSPKLAASVGGIQHPKDLLKLPMLDASDPWFAIWFEKAGVQGFKPSAMGNIKLGAQSLEAVAAIAGRGVAMLTPAFYADDLATGRLIQPFDLVANDGYDYFLAYPEARRNAPKVRAFRDWIVGATADLRTA